MHRCMLGNIFRRRKHGFRLFQSGLLGLGAEWPELTQARNIPMRIQKTSAKRMHICWWCGDFMWVHPLTSESLPTPAVQWHVQPAHHPGFCLVSALYLESSALSPTKHLIKWPREMPQEDQSDFRRLLLEGQIREALIVWQNKKVTSHDMTGELRNQHIQHFKKSKTSLFECGPSNAQHPTC